jgi:CubicO group peptidase (beta-lactamase class C family)
MLTRGALRVTAGGDVVAEHVAGVTGGATPSPCGPRTRFQIASISKQFTAAAILALVQRGQLTVDDRLARWFPGGPDGWADITVHQLLSHTSGLGHWDDFPEIDVHAAVPAGEFLALLRSRPLTGRPGRRFSYSSPGFWLLAQIVGLVSGCGYPEFAGSALLEPAGLADTFVGSPGGRPHVASGHSDGTPVPSYELDHTGQGAGDLYSTVADLDRWNRRLPGLLGEPGRRMMFARYAPTGDSPGMWDPDDGCGYGCFLGTVHLGGRGPLTLRYHSGHNGGFNSFSGWVPERELSVVIMTNEDSIDPTTIARVFLAGY